MGTRLKPHVKFLQQAIETGDPQMLHAWRSAESAFPEHRYSQMEEGDKRTFAQVFIRHLVNYFAEHDRNVLGAIEDHLEPLGESLVAADWQALK